jgi:uncharacterized protein
MGDNSWRTQPKRLLKQTQSLIASELGSFLRAQKRPFSVVLHGGEPLLLGTTVLNSFLGKLRKELDSRCGISIQTNGALISESILDACASHNVTLSVSLDGPPDIHNRFRITRRQNPTHAQVIAGISQLKAHKYGERLFSGVLAVVDPSSDPTRIYDYFKDLGVPSVDFLYRDGNHAVLPFGKANASSTEYGSWMCGILDQYLRDTHPFRIRMLDDMMRLLLGGAGVKEGVGLTDYGILIIDTDGSIKKNDTLKSSPPGDGFGSGWTIGAKSLAEITSSAEFAAYHQAQRPTSSVCRSCRLLKICGGGMLTHRYKDGTDYDNPTVFCEDQKELIGHMERYVLAYHRGHAA